MSINGDGKMPLRKLSGSKAARLDVIGFDGRVWRPMPARGFGSSVLFAVDRFPAGGVLGAQILTATLSHVPVDGSLHLYVNGLEQDEGVDYTRNGAVLTITAGIAIAGDVVEGRYAYDAGSPLIDFSSGSWRYLQVPRADATNRSAAAFDDSTWSLGSTPFGENNGGGEPGQTYNTAWQMDSKLWVRTTVPHGKNFSVKITVDDDATLYWNGTAVTSVHLADGTVSIPIPPPLVTAGDQTIAVKADDTSAGGPMTQAMLDVQVSGVLT